ncbi:MAG TPA: hypothetical protein VMV18_03460 [bacterium]|nr:hypothetical protein [bacterium]
MNSAVLLAAALSARGMVLAAPPPAAAPSATPSASPTPAATPAAAEDAASPAPAAAEWTSELPRPTRRMNVDDAVQRIWYGAPQPRFRPTTAGEKEHLHALLTALTHALREDGTDATIDPAWEVLAHKAGFSLEAWTVDGESYWAMVEEEGDRRGAGAYILRVSPLEEKGPQILLEAPHVYYDLGTENLGASLFFSPPAGTRAPRALFTNTVHRYQNSPDPESRTPNNPADICHNADHLFTAATVDFAEAFASTATIELHGFADNDPEAKSGLKAGTSIVVSGGVAAGATPFSRRVADGLRGLDKGVRLFPEEAKALGATTNVQGMALRALKGALFVHVETSASMRHELNLDGEKRTAFGRALLDAAVKEGS